MQHSSPTEFKGSYLQEGVSWQLTWSAVRKAFHSGILYCIQVVYEILYRSLYPSLVHSNIQILNKKLTIPGNTVENSHMKNV